MQPGKDREGERKGGRESAYFLRMERKVRSLEPSLWCSSWASFCVSISDAVLLSGVDVAGGDAAGGDGGEEDDVDAMMGEGTGCPVASSFGPARVAEWVPDSGRFRR